jgi:hypothetical protein
MIIVKLCKFLFALLLYSGLFIFVNHFLLLNFSEKYRERDNCRDLGGEWSKEKNICEFEE